MIPQNYEIEMKGAEMNPIEKLKAEHQIILKGIELLEKGADLLEKGTNISPDYFRKSIDFIRNYADKYHHAKEEDILFVRLGNAGFSSRVGPVAVMLAEHDQGRGFVSLLEQANEKYAAGDKKAASEIIKNARAYAQLLKNHIQKENIVLYPMAQNALGDDGINRMQPEFDRAEQNQGDTEKKYLRILDEMERN
jgi:hemerythrin-like domain-containing protein